MARLLEAEMRPQEAMEVARTKLGLIPYAGGSGLASLVKLNQITGRTFQPRDLIDWRLDMYAVICFRAGNRETHAESPWGDPWGMGPGLGYLVIAPSGSIFRKIRIIPISDSPSGDLVCVLTKDRSGDAGTKTVPAAEAVAQGVTFDNLPRAGLLQLSVRTSAGRPIELAGFNGLRAEAEFEPLGEHGEINISCTTGTQFQVEIDGRPGRSGPGLLGLVPPGEHSLRFTPAGPDMPVGEWQTKVTVPAGGMVSLAAHLPWKEGSRWAAWSEPLLLNSHSPLGFGHIRNRYFAGSVYPIMEIPAILAEEDRIVVLWGFGEDLWISESRDGRTFTAARPLNMPVTTAWQETSPRLVRDETGRYLLYFISDRNNRHEPAAYLCWSRDLEHWSAPALLEELGSFVPYYNFLQNCQGQHFAVGHINESFLVWSSPDAARWQKVGSVKLPRRELVEHELFRREDGRLELILWPRPERPDSPSRFCRYLSGDGLNWSTEVLPTDRIRELAVTRAEGLTQMIGLRSDPDGAKPEACLLREKPGGQWEQSAFQGSIVSGPTALAYHPKWGYMIAWVQPRREPGGMVGPFFMRGPSLEPLAGKMRPLAEVAAMAEARPQASPPVMPRPESSTTAASPEASAKKAATQFSSALATGSLAHRLPSYLNHRPVDARHLPPDEFREAGPRPILSHLPARQTRDPDPPPEQITDAASFLRAVARNDSAAVTAALAGHPEWSNARSAGGATALFIAAYHSNKAMVTLLLDHGAEVKATVSDGWTALHAAAHSTVRPDMCRILIEKGADVKARTGQGYTPLHTAAFGGSKELVEYLLSQGADVRARCTTGLTPLHEAVECNVPGVVELLLAQHPDLEARETEYGLTPLLTAAWFGYADLLEMLLERGAKLDVTDIDGSGPLILAASNHHQPAVQLLVAKGVEVNVATREQRLTPLHYVALGGDREGTEILLSKGADPNARSSLGETPLRLAAGGGYVEVCKVLLAHGAEARVANVYGMTPLHSASSFHCGPALAELLIAKGADINARNKYGCTPLTAAIQCENKTVVEFLRKHGAVETPDEKSPAATPQPSATNSPAAGQLLRP